MERLGNGGWDLQSYTRSIDHANKWLEQGADGLRAYTMVRPLNPPKVTTFSFERSGDWSKMYDNETGEVMSSDHDIRVDDILGFLGFEEVTHVLNTEEQEYAIMKAKTLSEALNEYLS